MTQAVTKAVRERLDRVRHRHGSGLADRLLRIGKDCAAHLKEPFRSMDHGDLLYDERGLPRIAREAYRDFGRGSGHPARLNFGDCFAYALAKALAEPILFKRDDFPHTDVTPMIS